MENCQVMLNGEMRECEILKENTHTIWVYTPNNLKKRKRIRMQRPAPDDVPYSNALQSNPIMLSMMPSIPESHEIDDNKIVKRHKRKHHFSKI